MLRYSMYLLLFCAFSTSLLLAQEFQFQREFDTIPFSTNGVSVDVPFAGGVTGSKPAFVDIDNDDDQDLFVGDSDAADGRIIFFRNNGTSTSPLFTLEGESFPEIASEAGSSPAFGDIDNDGDFDLVIGNLGRIAFYRNTGTAENPQFTLETDSLASGYSATLADILDSDGLGLVDLVVGGDTLRVYRNNGAGFDEPVLLLDTDFAIIEAGEQTVPAFADIDNDGDLDLFVGEFDGNINYYRNTGIGLFTLVTDSLASDNIGLRFSSSPTLTDIDGDDDLDLFIGEREGNINFYINDGTPERPDFIFQTETFAYLDVGFEGAGTFADIDADGDSDLFFAGAQFSLFQPGTPTNGKISFYRNTGTDQNPSFNLESDNFIELNVSGFDGIAPVFADIDADSLLELFIAIYRFGDQDFNRIYFFENDGTRTDPAFRLVTDNYPIGGDYVLSFADIDSDDDLDGFVGRYDGPINFYRNVGTATTPNFTFEETVASAFEGIANPTLADIDNDGDLDLFTGGRLGFIRFYRNVGDSVNFDFRLEADNFAGVRVGNYIGIYNSKPIFEDIGADGDLDLFVGEFPGGLHFYRNLALPPDVLSIAPPTVVPDPADYDNPIDISTAVISSFALEQVSLHYRQGGEPSFTTITMTQDGERYSGTIPKETAGARGVEFMIEAIDVQGNRASTDTQFVQVRLPAGVLTKVHQGGDKSNAYRLRSFPLNSDDKSIQTNLIDPVGGEYEKSALRIFDIDPAKAFSNQPFREYSAPPPPGFSDLAPGRSVFYITRTNATLTNGSGLTVNTVEPFMITLQPGWNMFAIPFFFNIPRENIDLGGLASEIVTYRDFDYPPVVDGESLQPWEGYLVYNDSTQAVTLTIHPTEEQLTLPPPLPKSTLTADWFIQIKGGCEYAQDNHNTVGVVADAAMEWDRHERYEPPLIGGYVSIHFPHLNWQVKPNRYRTDFRPPTSEGCVWEFVVETNFLGEPVTLTFDNLESVPQNFEMRLEDISQNMTHDLLEQPQYIYSSSTSGQSKAFRLVVGTRSFVEGNITIPAEIPETFALHQNFPNPFNPSTTIKFDLPKSSRVELKIYNVLGQEVVTLLSGVERAAGQYAVVWDGKDRAGTPVTSGVYVYQLRAGDVVLTRKMTFLK